MKYNDNGIIKDIVIKSGDTLPVGTIVEYDGEVIPAGYEEVEDNRNVYSTEEVIIGTWFGKPLYRKVIKYNPGKTIGEHGKKTIIEIPHNIANLQMCIEARGIDSSGGYIFPTISNGESSTVIDSVTTIYNVTNNNISFHILDDTWGARDFYFILEYIKTTD